MQSDMANEIVTYNCRALLLSIMQGVDVDKALIAVGLRIENRYKKMTSSERAYIDKKIKQLHQQGLSKGKIAIYMNIPEGTVRGILKRMIRKAERMR